eukprot:TRINITY_DN823_c0_g1_i2.p1 TRINITY_DN823_c0_g1~~TRINITY_DN823_c0_g1_i2.p1  ORF type:complete len:355 (+),score=96.32 TRINITY_DN823_c0_g1_i2:357-1421(+)
MGGGWCYTDDDCVQRASSLLGSTSSTYWPANMSDATLGLLSSNPTINPDFYNWNMAYFIYCDGGSFSGNVDGPVTVGNSTIYYRGHAVLTALVEDLLNNQGLSSAESVLIGGCSAGGLSTILHADYIASMLPMSAVVKALPDSGFFLAFPNTQGQYIYSEEMMTTFANMNSSGGVAEACLNIVPPKYSWLCYFAQYNYPVIQTPIFLLQSTYDSWQMGNIVFANQNYDMSCALGGSGNCTAEQIEVADLFHFYMLNLIGGTDTWNSDANGGYLHSCWDHCIAYFQIGWNNIVVGGLTIQQAVGDWFFERTSAPKLVDCMIPVVPNPANCNPTCPETVELSQKRAARKDILHPAY